MNPFSFFKKNTAPIETKSDDSFYSLEPGSFLEHVFSGGTMVTASQAAGFYRNTSAVATAVDMIAEAIEQIQPVIKLENGNYLDKHDILNFLKQPNGFYIWPTFIGKIARDYLLKRDALLTAAGNVKRKPIETWPESLQNISIIENVDRYPGSYIVTNAPITGHFHRVEGRRGMGVRFYDGGLKELYHIRGYSSRVSQIQADSPLQSASNEARQIIQGKAHNLKILTNGGRLSLLVSFKDEEPVDDDAHKDRIKKINEQYGGSGNAGKIGVISNADITNIKEFGINNRDMDYGKLESMAAMAIFLRYQIPLSLVTTNASTFNNLKTGVELLYDNAVLPTYDSLLQGLSFFLMPRFGMDPQTTRITYHPESIEPLKQRKLEEVLKRTKIAVETINELRSLLPNREPLKDGGDELYQPSNLVVVGSDQSTEDNNSI